MILMKDPTILSYSRPLYEDEVNELGEINLDEYRLNFGVFISNLEDKFTPIEIPAGIGRIVSKVASFESPGDASIESIAYASCDDYFNYVNMNLT